VDPHLVGGGRERAYALVDLHEVEAAGSLFSLLGVGGTRSVLQRCVSAGGEGGTLNSASFLLFNHPFHSHLYPPPPT